MYLRAFLSILGLAANITVDTAGCEFSKNTMVDIQFITDTILASHPGPVNDEDPEFTHRLNSMYAKVTAYAPRVHSVEEHQQLLQDYTRALKDPHVSIQFTKAAPTNIAKPRSCSMEQADQGVTWISIPTFVTTKTTAHAFRELIKQLPHCRSEPCIIFDLRGNGGGDSSWGTRIITELFSEPWTAPRIEELHQREEVYWRASTENVTYLASLITTLDKHYEPDSPEIRCLKTLQSNMKEALTTTCQPLVREPSLMPPSNNTPKDSKPSICPISGTVAAIIDRDCCSATLDFLDELKAVYPATILVGATTGSDSAYMEVRTVPLPSGLGTFTFPMKVYRNRARKAGIPYTPNICYERILPPVIIQRIRGNRT